MKVCFYSFFSLSRMVSWQFRRGLVKDSYPGRSRCPIVNGYFNIMISSNWSLVLSMHKLCLGEKWRTILELWRHWRCGSITWLSTAVTAVLQVSMLLLMLKNPRKIVFCLHPTFQPLLLQSGSDLRCIESCPQVFKGLYQFL